MKILGESTVRANQNQSKEGFICESGIDNSDSDQLTIIENITLHYIIAEILSREIIVRSVTLTVT